MAQEAGFIGIGAMGLPMAENLIAAGYKLRVYNRTASKAAPLIERGAELAANSAHTAVSGGTVVTMVSDDAALESLVVGADTIAHRLAPGGVHLSMSTVSPAISRRLARYHAECGSSYVAAPAFGRPDAARLKQMWLCASGPNAAKEKVRPLLEAMGQKVFDFGEDPGAANVVKLAMNFLIVASIEAVAEALTLAEKSGVDRVKTMEMLSQTAFACLVYQGFGSEIARMVHKPVSFRMELGLKDVELMLETGAEAGAPLPIAAFARERFVSSIARGRGDLDFSAIALCARDDAGLGERK